KLLCLRARRRRRHCRCLAERDPLGLAADLVGEHPVARSARAHPQRKARDATVFVAVVIEQLVSERALRRVGLVDKRGGESRCWFRHGDYLQKGVPGGVPGKSGGSGTLLGRCKVTLVETW